MKSLAWVVVMSIACGGKAAEPVAVVTLPTVASPSGAAPIAPAAAIDHDAALVRATVERWIDWLDRNEDERLIEDALLPEEREKLFSKSTMAEVLDGFRGEKHDSLRKILASVQHAKAPSDVRHELSRTFITYDTPSKHNFTLIVEGERVYIKD